MTNNGKISGPRCNVYRYNHVLANIDRLKILSLLKAGPRPWMEAFEFLYGERAMKGNFSYLLDGMREDLLIRMTYDQVGRRTILTVTEFGLEKLKQTIEEIKNL
jgi:hypothetical protein